MIGLNIFSSRKEKEKLLQEIIRNLRISPSEKEIYNLCIEVLDESGFEEFFKKITNQITDKTEITNTYNSIAPMTSTLI